MSAAELSVIKYLCGKKISRTFGDDHGQCCHWSLLLHKSSCSKESQLSLTTCQDLLWIKTLVSSLIRGDKLQ